LAILQTEVDRMLGHLDAKYLNPEDVTAAAIETLAYYSLDAQQSQYGRVGKVVEFQPRSRSAPVSKAADMAVPSYVERRVGYPPNERWQWIPATHPSALFETQELRCAWERGTNGLKLLFNYDPSGWGPYRLHYYADPEFAKALDSPLGLPKRFGFLFTHATILNAVTTVMNRAAQLPEDEQLNANQLNAISAQIGHSQAQVNKWEPLWKGEKDADKAPRGRNRRPVLGRMGLG
jgi:hypothetical protein